MITHTVKLNYEACYRDNMDPKKLWNIIQNIYESHNMYCDGENFIADFETDNYTEVMLACTAFAVRKWFFDYVSTWTSFDDEDGDVDLKEIFEKEKCWERCKS